MDVRQVYEELAVAGWLIGEWGKMEFAGPRVFGLAAELEGGGVEPGPCAASLRDMGAGEAKLLVTMASLTMTTMARAAQRDHAELARLRRARSGQQQMLPF